MSPACDAARRSEGDAPVAPRGRSRRGTLSDIRHAYAGSIAGRPVEASTAATLAYIVTLVLARTYTIATRGTPGAFDVAIDGVRLHHVVFGVLALLVAGVFALDDVFRLPRAILFGIGAALVLDELALVVFLKDVYWLPAGTLSIVAILVGVAALVVNAWRGRPFLRSVGAALRRGRGAVGGVVDGVADEVADAGSPGSAT